MLLEKAYKKRARPQNSEASELKLRRRASPQHYRKILNRTPTEIKKTKSPPTHGRTRSPFIGSRERRIFSSPKLPSKLIFPKTNISAAEVLAVESIPSFKRHGSTSSERQRGSGYQKRQQANGNFYHFQLASSLQRNSTKPQKPSQSPAILDTNSDGESSLHEEEIPDEFYLPAQK